MFDSVAQLALFIIIVWILISLSIVIYEHWKRSDPK